MLLCSLRYVDLYNCDMSDVGIHRLVSGSPLLEWLCIGHSNGIGPASYSLIGTFLQRLEGIDLGNQLMEMTASFVSRSRCVRRLLQLPLLRFVGLSSANTNLRQTVARRRPRVEILIDNRFRQKFKQTVMHSLGL